jgi:predicted transcriptional regulator
MGQVTIYLDNDLEQKINAAAKAAHLSKSRWVAAAIRKAMAAEWSDTVKESAGSWEDFPSAEELRMHDVADTKRESL